uniref:H15 domain-containing protein n=1 Tax=Salarias fasciatus TaxID=181472 RepID=A0A672GES0_SALFA
SAPAARAPAPAAAPVKAQKKRGPRPSKARTPLSKLIVEAVGSSQSRRGVSTQAVKKVLLSRGVDVRALNTRINLALVRLVRKGVLKQVRGVGASGSFVLAKKTLEESSRPARRL